MTLKLGIVGTGGFSKQHLHAIDWLREHQRHNVRVVAAHNRSQASNERAVLELGIPAAYATSKEMIESEHLDGIIIAVSATNLFEVTQSLIPYQIPLLVEKPPGLSSDDAKALSELATKHETSVLVGFNRRYYSIVQQAKTIIEQAGGLLGMRMDGFERYRMYRENQIVSEENLELLLTTNSIHCIDLIREYVGNIQRVEAFHNNHTSEPFNHRYSALIESETNIPVTFQAYWHSYGNWNYELYYPDGRIQFTNMEEATVYFRNGESYRIQPTSEDAEVKPGMVAQIEHFLQYVVGTRGYHGKSSIHDAVQTMELIEKIKG